MTACPACYHHHAGNMCNHVDEWVIPSFNRYCYCQYHYEDEK